MSHVVVCFLCLVPAQPVEADVVLRGATLFDGSGKPGVKGDLALKGDRITGVGKFEVKGKPREIDATGLYVAPGFIDLHSHSDRSQPLEAIHKNVNFLTQGVSTVVTGNCGLGPCEVGDYYKKLEEGKLAANVAHQIPHNDLRRKVMGEANRPPTKDELEKMKQLVEQGMKEGAWGLSTGLYYTPGSFADTEEIVELCKVVAKHGGFHATHMRNESADLLPCISETLEIGRKAGLPVHISHFKSDGRRFWGKAADAVALVEAARKKGQAVTVDQYPYTAHSTKLEADVIPPVFREGTREEMLARLDDPEKGPKMKKEIQRLLDEFDGGKIIQIARYKPKPEWQGRRLSEIAKELKKEPLDVVIEIEKGGGAQIVAFTMSDEDVRLIMKQPFVATASDGGAMIRDDTVPHPRNYGTFPRKIGHFAIAEKLIPVEQAIRSATGLPADILGMKDRGYLKPGHFADVVVFDPKTFRDTATFDKPHQYATGVVYLYVNGVPAVEKGEATGAQPGRVLRHVVK